MTDKRKYNSLGLAVKANDVDGAKSVMEVLTARQQTIPIEEWTTLLFSTLETMTPEMATYLRQSGADTEASIAISESGERQQVSSLGYAVIKANNKPLLLWMIEQNWIDEKMVSPSGDTLLVQAIREHAFDAAEILMEAGMSIDYQNLRGVSPLHEAASKGDYIGLLWLMERKANPTLETMQNAVASELVPEESEDPLEAELLFASVDQYYKQFLKDPRFVEVPQFVEQKALALIKAIEDAKPKPTQPKPSLFK